MLGLAARGMASEAGAAAEIERGVAGAEGAEAYADLRIVEQQVLRNARNAFKRAQRRGLTGGEAGNYSDQLFNELNEKFDARLDRAGSPYRIQVQPARDATGNSVPARTNGRYTAESKRLDATIVDTRNGQVVVGYDITFSTSKWNKPTDNLQYQKRFGLQKVTEVNPAGPR
jgi:hypothetical protein